MKQITAAFLLTCLSFQSWSQDLPPAYVALEQSFEKNDFEDCIRMARQIETIAAGRLDTVVSNSYFYIGASYAELGEIKKAIRFLEREKSILHALKMTATPDYSNSLNNLAYLYLQNGDYALAGTCAEEILVIDAGLLAANDPVYVSSVLNVAEIFIRLDRLGSAHDLLRATLKSQPRNSLNRANILNKMGDLYAFSGQYSRADRALREARDILAHAAGEDSPEYASAAINLGVLSMHQGKYPEAEEIFEGVLANLDPSEPAYVPLLNNQALVWQSLGQLERAENMLNRVKELDSITFGNDHPEYAVTLSNLGLVCADREKYREAEALITQALDIQKSNGEGSSLSFARKLNNLAKVHQLMGSPGEAVSQFERSMAIFRKTMGKNSADYATSAYNLGLAYWQAGKGDIGFRYLKASAEIRAKVLGKNHPKYAESLLKMGEYQWHIKSTKAARESFGEVFQNYYFQIDQTFPVLTEEEKSKFFYVNIRTAFDKFNSFAVSNHHEEPGLVGDIYNYLINTKAAIMIATGKVKTAIMSSGDSTLIRQLEEWQANKEQIAKLYSLNQEHRQLDSLIQITASQEKELSRRSSVFADQIIRKKFSYGQIHKSLKPGEAAVEVLRFVPYNPAGGGSFSGEPGYAFLVVTAETEDHPTLIMLEGGNDLETKYLKYYRNNIKFSLQDDFSFKHYFEPLAAHLEKENITRLYFSPDGVFNQINLASIRNPQTGKYLVDEYDLRLITNTRELVESGRERTGHQSSVLMGFPKYNLETSERAHTPEKNASRGNSVNREWRGGLLRYMRGEDGISVLPGTQVEIQKISKLFEGAHVFTSAQASERTAKDVVDPKVLHIATHGYFLEDEQLDQNRSAGYISSPLLNAGLILAGAENFLRTGEPVDEHGDDGILTAFEAMNLRLDNTQLVVLSACETALGDVKNGEGVYGLQRAFKLAGAQSIIMSLWNVDDEATQQLMVAFYEEMIRTGDQHEAFRTAQQRVKEKFPSPYYWGAFVLVGM